MKVFLTTTVTVLFIGVSSILFAQDVWTTPTLNRIIIKHYPGNQLANLEQSSPGLVDQLNNYFTKSFTATLNNCNECDLDGVELFNRDLFDVSKHEGLRAQNTAIQFQSHDGKYTIELISKNDLSTLIGSSYEELMLASFPKWEDSGNIEHDFEQYHNNVMLWAKNHPEIYRTYTASTGLMKVRLNEFEAMPQQKKDQVFNNPGGYLIIH